MSSITEVKFEIKPSVRKKVTKSPSHAAATSNGAKDAKDNDKSLKVDIKKTESVRVQKSAPKPSPVVDGKTANDGVKPAAGLDNFKASSEKVIGKSEVTKSVKDTSDKQTDNANGVKSNGAKSTGENNAQELKNSTHPQTNSTKALLKENAITNVLKDDATKTTEKMTVTAGSETPGVGSVGKAAVEEKKITNLEREKMMSQQLKAQLQAGVLARETKAHEKALSMVEQEKQMDFESETASMISERPTPLVTPKPSVMELDKAEETGNSAGFEPGNMMDELQNYLKKRFGPLLANTVDTDAKIYSKVEKTTDLSTSTEKTVGESEKPVTVDATVGFTAPKPPIPGAVPILPHPIIFKTSIKKDPGSKLHDDLIKELSTVMQKRETGGVEKKTDGDKTESSDHVRDESKIPKRRISAKGNKILGNKALLASLESQLNRTLHKHKVFQRQRLKVLGMDTVEVGGQESGEQSSKKAKTEESNVAADKPNDTHDTTTTTAVSEPWQDPEFTHKAQLSPVSVDIKAKPKLSTSSIKDKNTKEDSVFDSLSAPEGADKESDAETSNELTMSPSDIDKLFVYAIEHPEGWTEGVVCSVEQRQSTRDSFGKPRQYLTCINIVAEKSVDEEGCPFIQEVEDGGLPTASGGGLYMAEEDKPAHFNVDVGRRKGDLRVSVSGPNSIAKCSVDPQSDGSYTVTYIPVETGIFDISVTWNGADIPGSPYHPKVLDARKVKIIGGWQHFMDSSERVNLMVGEQKQLPFDVSEAGPGTFRAEVKGPSRSVEVDIDNHVVGRATMEFTPIEEGNHYIHLFWSDIPLVSSPFLGYAIKYHADPSKLILTGKGLKEAIVREEAEFMIDGSQAGAGSPEVVLSGVRAEVNVKVTPVGNGKFRCQYVPMVPGAYLLHITWNGRQLRGSPYKVNVIGAFYPNKVVVSGDVLRGGILGREMDVRIDTRKAGPGELTAYCMGPHQVAYCDLEDNRDGTFRLGMKAQEPGRHVLQVKYGGEHVNGSPFVFKVTSQPDASKVRVVGPGVEHGILATFISRFTVETKGAGAGQLTVRIRGPKGGFQVEMYRESQRERTILCRYDPTECGLYVIVVKWSGVDVPGSPFHVHICDTQEDMEQVLNDVSYSLGTSHSHTTVPSHHGGSQVAHVGSGQRGTMGYAQWREQI